MKTLKLFKTALTALRVNVLRSVLTMLGICSGSGASLTRKHFSGASSTPSALK